jgi:hypothetical protein
VTWRVRDGPPHLRVAYLPALTRPNVELVTAAIREVGPHGIVHLTEPYRAARPTGPPPRRPPRPRRRRDRAGPAAVPAGHAAARLVQVADEVAAMLAAARRDA